MSKEYEVVVVGGGIAGLTAGLTAARLGRSTLVLTGDVLGGHLLNIERIDGFPGFADGVPGYDLCPIAQEQAAAAGAEFAMTAVTALGRANGNADGNADASGGSGSGNSDGDGDGDGSVNTDVRWRVATGTDSYLAAAVILATGTELRKLGVPGETLLRGKGVSQCASCDAPLLRDRDVVVAGGGDSALQEALTLAEHCSSVTIVHHGNRLTAQAAYVAAAEAHAAIACSPNSEITEIVGENAVERARIKSTETGDISELDCAAVFGFIGLESNSEFINDPSILDDTGAIVTDSDMRTRSKGLLAAGTVRSANTGRAASAAGDGASAALAADRYLTDGRWPTESAASKPGDPS